MKARTKAFALDVLEFARGLPTCESLVDIQRQLTRSATAVGANYRSACRARSRAEFIARIGVVLEEADESAFWLEVMTEGKICAEREAFRLLDEADQLSAIFAHSRITASARLNRSRR